jgi:hypothetical protein
VNFGVPFNLSALRTSLVTASLTRELLLCVVETCPSALPSSWNCNCTFLSFWASLCFSPFAIFVSHSCLTIESVFPTSSLVAGLGILWVAPVYIASVVVSALHVSECLLRERVRRKNKRHFLVVGDDIKCDSMSSR